MGKGGVMTLDGWRMSSCTKYSFAVGGIPAQVTSTVIAFFLTPFMLEVVQLRPAYVAVIMLVARVFDSFSDPLVGFMTDHTVSSMGRRRPWIFVSIIPVVVVYTAVFFSPELIGIPLDTQAARFAYYCTAICLFSVILTTNYVPYTALTMELSDDPR
jgi:GPH family glycoside/pentoside/hexuronide:cation symporter